MMINGRIPGGHLLLGSALFNFASGCYTIVLGQSLFEATGSVGAFTVVVTIEYVGPILLGAVAGSLSDRVNAALLCMWSSLLAAVSLFIFIAIPDVLPIAGVILGLAINILRPFYRAGIFAAGPRSVAKHELGPYNLRWTVSVQAGQIVGGAVGGLVLAFVGESTAFFVAGLSFALSAFAMWRAKFGIERVVTRRELNQGNWVEVIRQFSSFPRIVALLLVGVDFVTISVFTVALAPLVSEIFGDTFWLGILDALFALGAILVSLISGRIGMSMGSLRETISRGYAIQIVGLLVLSIGLMSHLWGPLGACLGSVILGAGMALSSSQQVSFLQNSVDEKSVGKVGALRQAIIGVTTASALPLIGMIIGRNLFIAYLCVAGFLAVCMFCNFALSRREQKLYSEQRRN